MKLFLLSLLSYVAVTVAFVVQPVAQSLPKLSNRKTEPAVLRLADKDEIPPFLEEKTATTQKIDNASPTFGGLKTMSEGIDMPDIGTLLGKLDLSAVSDAAGSLVSNVSDGELGTRGESYTLAKLAVLVCILGGGIPFIGDLLMFLLGPVLLAGGLGVIVVAFQDLGDALSPWPLPASSNSGVVKDGIYSKVRHPFYAGILVACVGLSVATGSATRLLLTAGLLYVIDIIADYEEEELAKMFAEYESYKKEVPGKFFPQEVLDSLPWTQKD